MQGDTGGDGQTVGAPGQWYGINVFGVTASASFVYADVLYAGYGSSDYNYGAIPVSSGMVTIGLYLGAILSTQRTDAFESIKLSMLGFVS